MKVRISTIEFLILTLACLSPLRASGQEVANLFSTQGTVDSRNAGTSNWALASEGDKFNIEDAVRTAAASRAGIRFVDGILLRLNEYSLVQFSKTGSEAVRPVQLDTGEAFFFSREPRQFPEVKTPVVSAAVRGTEFVVRTTAKETTVTVLEGTVYVSNSAGSVTLKPGEEAYAQLGKAPVKRITVKPVDAVEWALYYPAVVSWRDLATSLDDSGISRTPGWERLRNGDLAAAAKSFSGSSASDCLGRSIVGYRNGSVSDALRQIDSCKAKLSSGAQVFRTSLLLSAGSVDQARKSLTRLSASNLNAGQGATVLALKSILALIRNEKDEARDFAAQALAQDPRSSSAKLAQSYIEQASFDISKAEYWVREAVKDAPEGVTLKARLAELRLAQGFSKDASALADEALASGESDAFALSVKGFIELSRYDSKAAQRFFERAKTADPTTGLPHLGLGLALIRLGELTSGRAALEEAAHLEPTVAMYRSYLGKAFFEEEREHLADREFNRAIELDDKDPTPFLYRAFLRLSTHQPVLALSDLEDSISRNDNRAVYRSSFLLDQDQAVRGASLGQVFRALSFGQAAKVEAIRSINHDFTNYSAHRLLSDSYSDDPHLTQAANSESRISNLLAPVNFNALFPNSSSSAGLNEYASLFDRPQTRTRLEGLYGFGDKTFLGNAVNVGTTGDFGYFLAYRPTFTNGGRNNSDERNHNLLGQLQYQANESNRFLLSVGGVSTEKGDTGVRFDPKASDPDSGSTFDTLTATLGHTLECGTGCNLLSDFSYGYDQLHLTDLNSQRETTLFVNGPLGQQSVLYPITTDLSSYQMVKSLRYSGSLLIDSELASLSFGTELFSADTDSHERSPITSDRFNILTGESLLTASSTSETSESGYGYATFHVAKWMDVTGGLNYKNLEYGGQNPLPPFFDRTHSENRLAQKYALTFYPSGSTSLRVGYIESLSNSGITDLATLEPTTLGGFNQLEDDLPVTFSRNIVAGGDVKLAKSVYAGSEISRRRYNQIFKFPTDQISLDLNTGSLSAGVLPEEDNDLGTQTFWRNYVYKTIGDNSVVTLDHFILNDESDFFGDHTRTNRTRANYQYFFPSGYFGFTNVTWRDQSIETATSPDLNGSRDFWIWNAGGGYQFAKRRGTVTLAVNNILDERFKYRFTGREGQVLPSLNVLLALSVTF